jgi:hypothetical protein
VYSIFRNLSFITGRWHGGWIQRSKNTFWVHGEEYSVLWRLWKWCGKWTSWSVQLSGLFSVAY